MSTERTLEMTNVVGFFNPNSYPMQIVVAEHNLTLQLKPKQWIVDRGGRIVNDPILDKYVGKGRLSRASDQAKKVEVIRLQATNRQMPPGQVPAVYQHPVYQATGFVRDPNGQMAAVQALPTAPQPTVPPPVSYNPVQAMSVEQARKLRLIKPVRYVPEDDGVSDTAGVPIPGDQTPPIKYAVDTTREKQPTALVAQPVTAEQAALIETMKAAQSLDPDATTFADDAAALAMKAQAQGNAPVIQSVPPLTPTSPLLERLTKALPSSPPPIPTNPEPTVMIPTELPDPVLTSELPAPTLVVEEEIGLVPSTNPVTASVPVEGAAKPATACPLCPGQAFSSTGYLVRHINRKHADRSESLMRQLGLV
jgi:hypothetical protein